MKHSAKGILNPSQVVVTLNSFCVNSIAGYCSAQVVDMTHRKEGIRADHVTRQPRKGAYHRIVPHTTTNMCMLCLGPLLRAFVGRLCYCRSLQKHSGLFEGAEHGVHFSECVLELLDALGTCQHHLQQQSRKQKGKREKEKKRRSEKGGWIGGPTAVVFVITRSQD